MVIFHDKRCIELWFEDLMKKYVGGYIKGDLKRIDLTYNHFNSRLRQQIKYLVNVKGYYVVFWNNDKTSLIVYNK